MFTTKKKFQLNFLKLITKMFCFINFFFLNFFYLQKIYLSKNILQKNFCILFTYYLKNNCYHFMVLNDNNFFFFLNYTKYKF